MPKVAFIRFSRRCCLMTITCLVIFSKWWARYSPIFSCVSPAEVTHEPADRSRIDCRLQGTAQFAVGYNIVKHWFKWGTRLFLTPPSNHDILPVSVTAISLVVFCRPRNSPRECGKVLLIQYFIYINPTVVNPSSKMRLSSFCKRLD